MHSAVRSVFLLLALSWGAASQATTYTADYYYLPAVLPWAKPTGNVSIAGAAGISDSGKIVGSFHEYYSTPAGFLYNQTNGAVSTFRYPSMDSTTALGVNNNGDVVGNYQLGYYMGVNHGFLYSNDVYTTIDHPDVSPQATAQFGTRLTGINDSGLIVGNYYTNYHNGTDYNSYSGGAFFYENGIFTAIADPSSDGISAYSLNNNGQVVGTTNTYSSITQQQLNSGFIYDHGTFTRLDHPDAEGWGTFATGNNDFGQVVGYYMDSSDVAHSFLYFNGVYTDLPLPNYVNNSDSSFPTTLSNYALDINNDGVILAEAQLPSDFNNITYAVVLTPVPEPSLYTMMASGLGILAFVMRKRNKSTGKFILS